MFMYYAWLVSSCDLQLSCDKCRNSPPLITSRNFSQVFRGKYRFEMPSTSRKVQYGWASRTGNTVRSASVIPGRQYAHRLFVFCRDAIRPQPSGPAETHIGQSGHYGHAGPLPVSGTGKDGRTEIQRSILHKADV